MREKPTTLPELLQAALRSQVELGLGEMIIDPARVETLAAEAARGAANQREEWVDRMDAAVRRTSPPPVDLFGGAGGTGPKAAQFGTLAEHRAAICECRNCPLGRDAHEIRLRRGESAGGADVRGGGAGAG
ncbi:MAG TPA: hypothetical protein PKM94_07655 [candidate division Zixibacteria bacterium]|nr:hypothetical protein [candidate division Zixibacteria bacterium]